MRWPICKIWQPAPCRKVTASHYGGEFRQIVQEARASTSTLALAVIIDLLSLSRNSKASVTR